MSLDLVPTSLRRSWILSGLLSLAGMGLAVELTLIHVRVHANPATRSFCTLSEHVSCDKTAQSAYSILFGVPLSVWGLLTYWGALVLCIWGWRSRKVLSLALLSCVSALCASAALALAALSLRLGNLCILCLASWVVDWALVLVVVRMAHRVGWPRLLGEIRHAWQIHKPWLVAAGLAGLGVLLGLRHVAPLAWGKVARQVPTSARSLSDRARALDDSKLLQGIDAAGHAYIGAADPKLTIVEFADYQCPHCANAHVEMRELLVKHPNDIRLVHRHFPLDNRCNPLVTRPFHTRACDYAKLAACAALAGKFWPANDWLFEHGRDEAPITSASLAQQLHLDAGQLQQCVEKSGADLIKGDIEEGLRDNIQGTPTFVVDGKIYPGHLPDDLLEPHE